MIRRLAFVALVFLAAGCSGGGGGTAPVPAAKVNAPANGTPASTGTANAQVQIVIPAPPTTASARRVQYISSATQSLAFAAANGNPIVVPLTPTSPGCTAGTNGTTCVVNVPLPVGANQQFVVSTFASTDGSGTALSVTKVTASIISGQANPISLTLGGVPKTVTLTAQTTPIPSVAATSIPVTVTVKDASGNTIVGSTPFSDANGNAVSIVLADSDASGATTVTPATLTAPGSATVAYDNYFQPTTATITASSTGLTAATTTLTFAAKPIIFAYANTGDTIAFGNNTGLESKSRSKGSAAQRSVQTVSIVSTGVQTLGNLLLTNSTSAPYTLGTNSSSSSAGFADVNDSIYDQGAHRPATTTSFGIATAANGHAYITEWFNNQTGIFDAGTTPTWPAGSSIIAAPFGPIALGPGGKMYAAIMGGFEQINPATGAAIGAPVMVPGTFNQTVPNAIAVGKDGTVYVDAFETSSGDDDVLAFTATGSGFTFSHSFSTANSHQPSDAIYGLAVDVSNNVYISCDCIGSLDIVPASSQGEVLPTRVITSFHKAGDGANVLVDRAGNIIRATWATVSIYAPTAGTAPPPGTNPATQWYPATDTTALQTLYDSTTFYNDAFLLLGFGPGS